MSDYDDCNLSESSNMAPSRSASQDNSDEEPDEQEDVEDASERTGSEVSDAGTDAQEPNDSEHEDDHADPASQKVAPAKASTANKAAALFPATAASPNASAAAGNGDTPSNATAETQKSGHQADFLDEAMKQVQSQFSTVMTAAAGSAAAQAAQGGFANITSGFANWWGAKPAEGADRQARVQQMIQEGAAADESLKQHFKLALSESVVESFACKLVQTYACTHNSHTPSIQMVFGGKLHITEANICFLIEERGKQLPLQIAHVFVARCKQEGSHPWSSASLLKISLKDNTYVCFKDFSDAEAHANATALVQHLTEAASAAHQYFDGSWGCDPIHPCTI
eukprot:TRINITY_DN16262_c0_g1_i1.p1 TRINITY_DN16262_c0_g1~~TRINITY_DN16262_c0_g1_i1.p1  ORF type:complete len:339 (-),score=46.71 TRINITY_DN16262_c0_g1_i1:251-1267(-)